MNQENKQLPTASQSLYKWNFKLVHEDMAKCIDEHTRLHAAPLLEELEKLRAWKESAMKTLADVDIQECGKLLNVGLGQSISDKIVPGIKELRAENERLKSTPGNTQVMLAEAYHRITAENQKLREALEKCKTILSCWDDTESVNKVVEIAKEALKGGKNE